MNQPVVYTPSGGLVLRESPPKFPKNLPRSGSRNLLTHQPGFCTLWGGMCFFFFVNQTFVPPLRSAVGFSPERLESQAPWSTACTSRMARMARMARGRWLVFCGGWMTWVRTNLPTKMVVVFFEMFVWSGLFIFWKFFLLFVLGRVEK